MPYFALQTNDSFSQETRSRFLAAASREISEHLGKSESYFMGIVQDGRAMIFAGTEEPAAMAEISAIGLQEDSAKGLAEVVTRLVKAHLGVPEDRIYVSMMNFERSMWAWNGNTFG